MANPEKNAETALAAIKKAAAEGRPFEDLFSEYQSEMIRQSIAYAENRAEKIYVYSDFECGAIMARPAFIIEGKFYPDYEWDKAIRGKNHLQFPERKKGIYEGRFCVMRLLSVSCVSSTRGQCRR